MAEVPVAVERTTAKVFLALERFIAFSGRFVATWGKTDPALLAQLEAFVGQRLPEDYRAFLLRFGNAQVGYVMVNGLGPLRGITAVQSLTESWRSEWGEAFPADCLALEQDNTDFIVLRLDGRVETRTGSSHDLAVLKSHGFPSFTAFLAHCIERAVHQGEMMEQIRPGFLPWEANPAGT